MTPDFMAVARRLDRAAGAGPRSGDTVEDSETLNVISRRRRSRGHLIDDLRVRQLLLADPAITDLGLDLRRQVHLSQAPPTSRRVAVHVCSRNTTAWRCPVIDSRGCAAGHRDGRRRARRGRGGGDRGHPEDRRHVKPLEQPFMQDRLRGRCWAKTHAGWLILLFMGQLLTLNALYRSVLGPGSSGDAGR